LARRVGGLESSGLESTGNLTKALLVHYARQQIVISNQQPGASSQQPAVHQDSATARSKTAKSKTAKSKTAKSKTAKSKTALHCSLVKHLHCMVLCDRHHHLPTSLAYTII